MSNMTNGVDLIRKSLDETEKQLATAVEEKQRICKQCEYLTKKVETLKMELASIVDEVSPETEKSKPSKKAAKKEAAKQERNRRREEANAALTSSLMVDDPLSENYGDLDFQYISTKVSGGGLRPCWKSVEVLAQEMEGKQVLLRGHAQTTRIVSSNMAFVVLRELGFTVQCVVSVAKDKVSHQMVKFAKSLTKESYIVVDGVVSVPNEPIKATTQKVEVQVRRIYCINRAISPLPINIEDAARSQVEIENAKQEANKELVRVNQDTRLNYRVLDLRTPANQAILDIKDEILKEFRRFLISEGFKGIQSPKLTSGSSEGGAAVFKLDYMGKPACLAQSPQLYKQMVICSDRGFVYEVGPVFRAEHSYTHRHLCEFTGLDVEMVIREHYSEVMDIVEKMFVAIFDHLNENCKKELEAINKQYPFMPLKYSSTTLRLTFEEGVEMLKAAGVEVDPLGDLSTETERKLGQLVKEKYDTEFYILHQYPLSVRPFYTMPSYDNNLYSNSFDVFMRGEEIISGAQRVHCPNFLKQRAEACGIDVKTISAYIDSFRYGAPPHGGFGAGLERVVMLFCGLDNIRKVSLFPRDPDRLTP